MTELVIFVFCCIYYLEGALKRTADRLDEAEARWELQNTAPTAMAAEIALFTDPHGRYADVLLDEGRVEEATLWHRERGGR